jgi:hypothetical protein
MKTTAVPSAWKILGGGIVAVQMEEGMNQLKERRLFIEEVISTGKQKRTTRAARMATWKRHTRRQMRIVVLPSSSPGSNDFHARCCCATARYGR